jgi:hypothetical protein
MLQLYSDAEILKIIYLFCFVQFYGSPCQMYISHMVVVLTLSMARVIKMQKV